MTDEEMEFVRKVNIDKANNKTGIAIVLIVLSIITTIIVSILMPIFSSSTHILTILESYLK